MTNPRTFSEIKKNFTMYSCTHYKIAKSKRVVIKDINFIHIIIRCQNCEQDV